MNWAAHPTLYGVLHPWHWLTYNLNSAALASVAACVGTVVVAVAAVFAYRTYLATVEQLKLAREETDRSRQLYLESIRPHLSVEVMPQSNQGNGVLVTVKNTGSGRALNVTGERINIICSSLPPDAEVKAAFLLEPETSDARGDGIGILRYASIDGRRFRTEAVVSNWRTVIAEKVEDISGITEPPLMSTKLKFPLTPPKTV
jgi:hypothetical protein